MQSIQTNADFDRLMKKGQSFIVYKHSSVCVISNNACRNVEHTITKTEHANDVIYKVDVIEDRMTSQYIADQSQIKHESPQIILFEKKRGKMVVTENVSHGLISSSYVEWVVNRAMGKKAIDFSKKKKVSKADEEKKAKKKK